MCLESIERVTPVSHIPYRLNGPWCKFEQVISDEKRAMHFQIWRCFFLQPHCSFGDETSELSNSMESRSKIIVRGTIIRALPYRQFDVI